uniref:Uncharacterized protein n=1 Tax=Arundo donax TaxID=35708 RepID=A0A0A9EZC9_ARUDO
MNHITHYPVSHVLTWSSRCAFMWTHLRPKHLHHSSQSLCSPLRSCQVYMDPIIPTSACFTMFPFMSIRSLMCLISFITGAREGKSGGNCSTSRERSRWSMVIRIPCLTRSLTAHIGICLTKNVIQIYVYRMFRWMLTKIRSIRSTIDQVGKEFRSWRTVPWKEIERNTTTCPPSKPWL